MSDAAPNDPILTVDHLDVTFTLPQQRRETWTAIVDTAGPLKGCSIGAGGSMTIAARSLAVWETAP